MTTTFMELDVRPTLRAGGEPFDQIMGAVAGLAPGDGLRVLATFKPVPLFSVLGSMGFSHEARELEDGEWEVLFTPTGETGNKRAPLPRRADEGHWPEPVQHLDNRELDPPEPMVRILAAIETMNEGDVLSALLCREPMFLIPELDKRGHRWRGGFEPDGSYRILVRIGDSKSDAA